MTRKSSEQAAYKKTFSVEDHLLTVHLLIERCKEWNSPLWLALVDFTKAFDSIYHDSIWSVFAQQGLLEEYICTLRKIYSGSMAYVFTGIASRKFTLYRGVKQGDPLSAMLFIAVLETCMTNIKASWIKLNARRTGRGYVIIIDNLDDPLTNLRFADDILLVSQSRSDGSKMLVDLSKEAASHGLHINLEKTKVLTTEQHGGDVAAIRLQGQDVDVLGIREISWSRTMHRRTDVYGTGTPIVSFLGILCAIQVRIVQQKVSIAAKTSTI